MKDAMVMVLALVWTSVVIMSALATLALPFVLVWALLR